MNLLQEYPKALTMLVMGVILYFVKPYVPELFSPEIQGALELLVGGLVIFLFGKFSRLSKSEAEKLNDPYKQ